MKKEETKKDSRRKFLSFGLLGAAGMMTKKVNAMTSIPEEDEKVPMLTADGKLVEISKKILDQSANREKARNVDVLKWREGENKFKK